MKRPPLFLVLLTLALALLPSCTPPGGGADAQQADIPAPRTRRYDRRGDGWGWLGGVLDVPVMERGPRTREIRSARGRGSGRST